MNQIVSVIIPVYNRQQYMEECIASLQAQTYTALEIILIDDGSTDATLDVCRKLAENDPRIKLLQTNHGGVSAARNIGLGAAQGEFLFFLDSDDVIHPQLIQVLVENMLRTGAAMAGTTLLRVQEKYWDRVPGRISSDCGPVVAEYKNSEDTLREVFTQRSPLHLIGGSMLRKEWVDQTRFHTDLYIGEDFYFLYENLIKGADAIFLRNKWYYERLHATNSSWDWKFSGFMNRFYRRQLVWESEERFGRTEYANIQKREALDIYLRFLEFDTITKSDKKKMREVMKTHKETLLNGTGFKLKILYIITVYLPFLNAPLLWLRNKKNQRDKPKMRK